MDWRLIKFGDFTPYELYELLRLRSEVFVVEQACIFLEMDNYDQACFHLLGYENGGLAAAARLVPAGLIYEQVSIGRVVTAPSVRGAGAGKALMQRSIAACKTIWGEDDIKIGAQLYLKAFYESFGFKQISDVYVEDGIDHIYMLRKSD
jgi:ElaA protein